MSHNGIWGGDLEINAISKFYKRNVIVFQDSHPNLEFICFPEENGTIQLAYFGSCHYNSVRSSKPIAISDTSSPDNIVLRSDEQEKMKKSHDSKKEIEMRMKERIMKEKPQQLLESVQPVQPVKPLQQDIHPTQKQELIELKKKEIHQHEMENLDKHEKSKSMKSDKSIKIKPSITPEQRNLLLLEKCRKKVETSQHKHHHCGEWCGNLSFDDLISINNRVRIIRMKRENQVKNTLKLLTMKCPCKSGSYFKYCCYPKIKAWYG